MRTGPEYGGDVVVKEAGEDIYILDESSSFVTYIILETM